jgi:hypothetical protein
MPPIGGSAGSGIGAPWDCIGKLNDPALHSILLNITVDYCIVAIAPSVVYYDYAEKTAYFLDIFT